LKVAALWLAILLAACDNRPKQWDAFVYPNIEGSDNFERISGFKTFELCQQAAIDRVRSLPEPEKAAYECGYMCGRNPDFPEFETCKETRK
jgi:hypothetical protein